MTGIAVGARGAAVHDLAIFGGLAAAIVVVVLGSRMAHRALTVAVARAEEPERPAAV